MSLFAKLRAETHLPGFDGATGWLNSGPLTPERLLGNVVLVDFWTYTCINWLRTLGYVRAWHEKYKDQGRVVVGVHTPEFPFEHDADNVRWAAQDLRVPYPIALDPEYAVWRTFSNNYWPAVYIADAEGRMRHMHFGEGGYEECERAIQMLLREADRGGVPDNLVSVADEGFEAQADWGTLGPAWTKHVFVGAGYGPCGILMVGTRPHQEELLYPADPVARKHNAAVATETSSGREAYAPFPQGTEGRYRDGALPSLGG